jgi:hypothetical protein
MSEQIQPVTLKQVDAAKRHGVSVRTIHRMEQRGKLHGKRVYGLKHYAVEELDRLFGVSNGNADHQE